MAITHDRHLSFKEVILSILSKCLDRDDIVHLIRNIMKYFLKDKMSVVYLEKAAFADTKEEFSKNWLHVSDDIKQYLGHLDLKRFIKVYAMEAGVTINDENTSNRVEQEMARTLKDKIRHEFVLMSFIRFAQQVYIVFECIIFTLIYNIYDDKSINLFK